MNILDHLSNLFKSSKSAAANMEQAEVEHALSEIEILEQDLKMALRSMNTKVGPNIFSRKKKRPLFLIIGAETAGKTTFLVNSGLDLKYFNDEPYSDLLPTRYCQWCFAKDAVFIDTAGSYTTSTSKTPALNLAWRGFIKLLARFRNEFDFAGVIIAIDLPHMAKDGEKLQDTLANIRARIYELSRSFKSFPIHLVFTKSDLIYGFGEFFSDLGLEESSQIFGIDLGECTALKPAQTFTTHFNRLLSKLHERLIWRLYNERLEDKRFAVQAFPFELESIRDKVINVVNELPSSETTPIVGIYFTSSIRHGKRIDYLRDQMVKNFSLREKKSSSRYTPMKQPYFIDNLVQKIVGSNHKRCMPRSIEVRGCGRLFLLLTLVLTLTAGSLFYYAYRSNIYVVNQVVAIKNAKVNASVSDHISLSRLERINQVLEKNAGRIKLAKWMGFSSAAKVRSFWQQKYVDNLQNNFIPQLRGSLESILVNGSQQSVEYLYSVLRTYLMFGEKEHFNADYIRKWFNQYWESKIGNNPKELVLLQQRLNYVLAKGMLIKNNKALVAKTKNTLSMMPKEGVVYAMLLSHSPQQIIKFGDSSSHVFNAQFSIADIYTVQEFAKTYNETIPQLVREVFEHDWVLSQTSYSGDVEADVINRVRTLYLQSYAKAWSDIVSSISVNRFSSVKEAGKELMSLGSDNSPLIKLLKMVNENTSFKDAPDYFVKGVTDKFAKLHKVDIDLLQQNLAIMADYFAAFKGGENGKEAVVKASGKIMQDATSDNPILALQKFSAQAPEPLKSWLKAMSDSAWHAMLQDAHAYISDVWQSQVLSYYTTHLDKKYPLFKSATSFADMDSFNQFFAANGIMDGFFKDYIEPFVDLNSVYWQWRSAYGYTINFQQSSLEMFMRAELIQKMFYSGDNQTPYVSFSLQAQKFSPGVQSFKLSLNGKTFIDTPSSHSLHKLAWEGEKSSQVNLEFVNYKGKNHALNIQGPWAWFKLLDKANLRVGSAKQRYDIIFDFNGNSAKYILTTDQLVNPFIPGVVTSFRCLESL